MPADGPSGARPAPRSETAGPGEARLVPPTVDVHLSYLAALAEFHGEGLNLHLDAPRLADRGTFARFVAALRLEAADVAAAFRQFGELGVVPYAGIDDIDPAELVPETVRWWVAGTEFLGRIAIRHHLTERLLRQGGHIGYEVRPRARGRGHATAMLAAALPLAAALGVERARIDCDVTNAASRRVVEKNGGLLEKEDAGSLYFWVPTGGR
jgi:RimJ/RimL family protein N-acetyltransferase